VARWRTIIGEVLDDATNPAACFAELFDHFSRPGAWRCTTATGPTLQTLANRGVRLGLASNYDERLRRVVAGLPELAPITDLLISSEVGWRKPSEAFFAALCRATFLPPERILLVGDDLRSDYDGAKAAGLASVLFDPDGRASAAVPRISCLSELL
jgi:putative hydrolase of the HAD superfamily